MDIRQIATDFAVAPQITPDDVPRLVELGFRTVLNNRPDTEIDAVLDAAAMRRAAETAGLAYHYLPYVPGQMSADLVEAFAATLAAAQGPVLAYCRSGTRSSHLWAMAVAGQLPLDEILRATAAAGYDLSALVPALQARATALA
jgi:sulfide:quinone oxidoreductase